MLILLAMILNIDALGIGVSYKIRGISLPLYSKIIISAFVIFSTYIAVLFGSYISKIIDASICNYIGSTILALTGLWIIRTSTNSQEIKKTEKKGINKIINIGNITITIVKKPECCDFDNSNSLDSKEAVYMGIVLSLDSFASGIGIGLINISPLWFSLFVGLFQMLFLYIGEYAGNALVKSGVLSDKTCIVVSGVLLILFAIIRIL